VTEIIHMTLDMHLAVQRTWKIIKEMSTLYIYVYFGGTRV
jgi:hypothetical protein